KAICAARFRAISSASSPSTAIAGFVIAAASRFVVNGPAPTRARGKARARPSAFSVRKKHLPPPSSPPKPSNHKSWLTLRRPKKRPPLRAPHPRPPKRRRQRRKKAPLLPHLLLAAPQPLPKRRSRTIFRLTRILPSSRSRSPKQKAPRTFTLALPTCLRPSTTRSSASRTWLAMGLDGRVPVSAVFRARARVPRSPHRWLPRTPAAK